MLEQTLDLSEVLMEDLHHNYIESKYIDKSEMLPTDRQIVLCVKFKLKMFMKTSTKIKELFGLSNYPKDSK